MNRALSYYTKGLSIDVRQRLFDYLKNDINSIAIKYFLEKEEGYPSFRSMGFTDDQIQLMCDSYIEKFEHANRIMAENGRPPLFADPRDSFQCAKKHVELMKLQSGEELVELFGCTYEDYVPAELNA